MKKNWFTLIICCLAFALSACQSEEELAGTTVGYLRLGLDVNTSAITRAEAAYNPKQLAVQIVNAQGEVVEETTNFETNWSAKTIELPVGKYTIKASSAGFDGTSSGFDKPYYTGSTEVTIESGKTANPKIECTLANVKVTVNFDQSFVDAFASAEVEVDDNQSPNNEGINPLTFAMGKTTQSGYFPVTDLKAVVSVVNKHGVANSQTNEITDVKARNHYILNYKVEESTGGNVTVTTDPSTTTYTFHISVALKPETEPTLTVSSANAWAKRVYLEGTVVENGVDLSQGTFSFQYRVKDATDWTTVSATLADGKYKATVTGLTPKTAYESRLVYGEESFVSEVKGFTTEETVVLYNGNLDEWWRAKDNDRSPWYPIADTDATSSTTDSNGNLFSFWDSGNGGTAMMAKNPTAPEESDVNTPGGKSAKLASQYVGVAFLKMGKFAAGNIFTGHFCSANTQTYQARICFGQPFASRPIQLKGWFKYNRGTNVDYPDGNDVRKTELINSGGDQCSVYIALTDNEGVVYEEHNYAYEINGDLSADDPENFKYKNTIDFSTNNPNIIAYGTLTEDEAKGTGEWQQFTINLKYRDLTRTPKYIIVVASASKYGDFFTGSSSSVMYIDDFELVYDGEPTVASQQ